MQYPHYDPALDNRPLDDAELEDLDRSLAALPQAMNIERLDGYLTALLLDPQPLPKQDPSQWLPPVWGGDGEGDAPAAPFASGKQKKRVVMLVLRHLHAIACQLRDHAERWQPVFSVAESGEDEFADAEEWCAGFLEAAALRPEAWDPLFDDPVLGPVLAPIALLGGYDEGLDEATRERLEDPVERDALSRAAMEAVLLLHERRSELPSAAP